MNSSADHSAASAANSTSATLTSSTDSDSASAFVNAFSSFSSSASSRPAVSTPIPPYLLFDFSSLSAPLESLSLSIRNSQKHLTSAFAASKAQFARCNSPADRSALLAQLTILRQRIAAESVLAEKHSKALKLRIEIGEFGVKEFEHEKAMKSNQTNKSNENFSLSVPISDASIFDPVEPVLAGFSAQKLRYYRILIDYLLRRGRFQTVSTLLKSHPTELRAFLDVESFINANRGAENLSQIHNSKENNSNSSSNNSNNNSASSKSVTGLSRALQWVGENRSRLNKLKIPMEFDLKSQEFIELIKSNPDNPWSAIEFARKSIAPVINQEDFNDPKRFQQFQSMFTSILFYRPEGNGEENQIQNSSDSNVEKRKSSADSSSSEAGLRGQKRLRSDDEEVSIAQLEHNSDGIVNDESDEDEEMELKSDENALLLKSSAPEPAPADPYSLHYAKYYSNSRWLELKEEFNNSHLKLLGLSKYSFLESTIVTGLAAIRTPNCGSHRIIQELTKLGKPSRCPTCVPLISSLTDKETPLPLVNRGGSTLICRLSGLLMGVENPPLLTPQSQIYSQFALQELAKKDRNGIIHCPISGLPFSIKECKPVYVV